MFKTCVIEELGDDGLPSDLIDKINNLISTMVDVEKRWLKYATDGLLGFTKQSIEAFIEHRANEVCKGLNIPLLYSKHNNNPLNKLFIKSIKGGELESRTNFFEANVTEYSKGSVTIDY